MSTAKRLFLLPLVFLCSCSDESRSASKPAIANLDSFDGVAVEGAPKPEVVRLRKISESGLDKHVTVGNSAGDYELFCNLEGNKDHGIPSCLSPSPDQDYLLFRDNTKWLVKGATNPIDLKFMEDWSVKYNTGENIGLMSAKKIEGENFGVYRLVSWTAK